MVCTAWSVKNTRRRRASPHRSKTHQHKRSVHITLVGLLRRFLFRLWCMLLPLLVLLHLRTLFKPLVIIRSEPCSSPGERIDITTSDFSCSNRRSVRGVHPTTSRQAGTHSRQADPQPHNSLWVNAEYNRTPKNMYSSMNGEVDRSICVCTCSVMKSATFPASEVVEDQAEAQAPCISSPGIVHLRRSYQA